MASTATPKITNTSRQLHLHSAPQKIEIEDRNNDTMHRESRYYDAENLSAAYLSNREIHDVHTLTSLARKSSEITSLAAEVVKLKALLDKKEVERKQIEQNRDTLAAQYKKIRIDKKELETFTKRRLVATKDKYMRELQERDDKLKKKQIKIDAAFAEIAELKSLLAKKEAENERIVSERNTLAAENKNMRSEKSKLEALTKNKLVSTKDKYEKVLQERNDKLKKNKVQIDAAHAELSKLKSLLAKKEAKNNEITKENNILEAKYKKSKSDNKDLEAYAKKKIATTKNKYQKVLQERNVKLQKKQEKIDALSSRNRREN